MQTFSPWATFLKISSHFHGPLSSYFPLNPTAKALVSTHVEDLFIYLLFSFVWRSFSYEVFMLHYNHLRWKVPAQLPKPGLGLAHPRLYPI